MINERLDLLREALPYIQRFKNKVFVVKLSGKVTENADQMASLAEEITLCEQVGIHIAVVHGGGKQLTTIAERLGITQKIVNGRRVTDDETLEIADMKTGSSGSGAKAAAGTHHPKRANSFYAYKIFEHQHQPEVQQLLASVNNDCLSDCRLVMQTHSLPTVRGIFASIYFTSRIAMTRDEIGGVMRDFYGQEFFIRLVEGSPDINWVKNTNFVDIGWATSGNTVIVFVALDNLVKGASGQAVQNMNLMFGIEERTGLVIAGTNP